MIMVEITVTATRARYLVDTCSFTQVRRVSFAGPNTATAPGEAIDTDITPRRDTLSWCPHHAWQT